MPHGLGKSLTCISDVLASLTGRAQYSQVCSKPSEVQTQSCNTFYLSIGQELSLLHD